jgi:hypothetical protein
MSQEGFKSIGLQLRSINTTQDPQSPRRTRKERIRAGGPKF